MRLHLATEELAAVNRAAERLDIKSEDLVYVALDRLMLQLNDPIVRSELVREAANRTRTLPRWSDTARSVHIYESQPDDEAHRSAYLRLDEW